MLLAADACVQASQLRTMGTDSITVPSTGHCLHSKPDMTLMLCCLTLHVHVHVRDLCLSATCSLRGKFCVLCMQRATCALHSNGQASTSAPAPPVGPPSPAAPLGRSPSPAALLLLQSGSKSESCRKCRVGHTKLLSICSKDVHAFGYCGKSGAEGAEDLQ